MHRKIKQLSLLGATTLSIIALKLGKLKLLNLTFGEGSPSLLPLPEQAFSSSPNKLGDPPPQCNLVGTHLADAS